MFSKGIEGLKNEVINLTGCDYVDTVHVRKMHGAVEYMVILGEIVENECSIKESYSTLAVCERTALINILLILIKKEKQRVVGYNE